MTSGEPMSGEWAALDDPEQHWRSLLRGRGIPANSPVTPIAHRNYRANALQVGFDTA
jgi:hypothetical protein